MLTQSLEMVSNRRAQQENEKKLMAIRTSLVSIEASISKFENIIKECQMLEDEVHQTAEEVASENQPKPEAGM